MKKSASRWVGRFCFFVILVLLKSEIRGQSAIELDTIQARKDINEALRLLTKENKADEGLALFSPARMVFGQVLGTETVEYAVLLDKEATFHSAVYRAKEGMALSEEALRILYKTQGPESREIGLVLHRMSRFYGLLGDEPNSLKTAEKALPIRLKYEGENSVSVSRLFGSLAGSYLNLGKPEEAEPHIQKYLRVIEKNNMTTTSNYPYALSLYGNFYYQIGDSRNALNYHLESLKAYQKTSATIPGLEVFIANEHIAIGAALINLGDYAKGLIWQQKALDLIQRQQNDANHFSILPILNNMGIAYSQLNDIEKSKNFMFKAIHLSKIHNGEESLDVAEKLSALAHILSEAKAFEPALQYARASAKLYQNLKTPNRVLLAGGYFELGEIYRAVGKIDSAEFFYRNGLQSLAGKQFSKDEILPKNYNAVGCCLARQGKLEAAKLYWDSAFQLLGYRQRGDFSTVSNLALLQFFLGLQSLEISKREDETPSQLLRSLALENSREAKMVLDIRLAQSGIDEERLPFAEKANDLFGAYLRSLEKTGRSIGRETEAFELFEKSRATVLSTKMAAENALHFGIVPDSLVAKDKALQIKIGYLENKKNRVGESADDEIKAESLRLAMQIQNLKETHAALKTRIERDYPDYYRLKYDHSTISLQDAQQKLAQPGQTYLEYFVGEGAVFLLAFTRDSARFLKIPLDFPLDSTVAELRRALTTDRATGASRFAETAHLLYQKLVAPVRDLISGEVVIVPDGVLGYLPFEVLLVEKPEKPNRFREHHYFLKDCAVSYALSSTLQLQMREQKHRAEPTGNFAAFAPFFDGDTATLSQLFAFDEAMRKDFQPLAASGEEAFGTAKLMRGEAILGPDATRKRFEEIAPKYRVLHLATHGKADDQTGDYAFLAFSKPKDSLTHDLLFVRDLYNMRLNADLVTLSACETGIGKLRRGEGIISLARAFVFAGAKSLVTSLWEVNDSKSKDLMLLFYKNLRRGMPKNEALRRAKLAFLERQDNVGAHPFFWSGFVGLGDMSALKK